MTSNDLKGISSFGVDEDDFLSSQVDIFQPPYLTNDVVDSFTQFYYPMNSLTSEGIYFLINWSLYYKKWFFNFSGPYEFYISSCGESYVDLGFTRLHGTIAIKKVVNGALVMYLFIAHICKRFLEFYNEYCTFRLLLKLATMSV